MRLLLDTHVVIWWLEGATRLREDVRALIDDGSNDVHVSAVTAVEMASKSAKGRLRTPDDLAQQMVAANLRELPITVAHGVAVRTLPGHHGDPFDRILVAQALAEGLILVTADRALAAYDVPILLAV